MIRFEQIKVAVTQKLQHSLKGHLVYHSVEHTLYVCEIAQFIASKEKIKGRDLLLIKLAALYHDTGFLRNAALHEEHSCDIAREDLKRKISATELEKICGMIMATKIPQQPTNALECIVADADLEYLGTTSFSKTSGLLYQELKYSNPNLSKNKWNKIQIDFLQKHKYHTRFCRQYREKYKRKHLENLIARIGV